MWENVVREGYPIESVVPSSVNSSNQQSTSERREPLLDITLLSAYTQHGPDPRSMTADNSPGCDSGEETCRMTITVSVEDDVEDLSVVQPNPSEDKEIDFRAVSRILTGTEAGPSTQFDKVFNTCQSLFGPLVRPTASAPPVVQIDYNNLTLQVPTSSEAANTDETGMSGSEEGEILTPPPEPPVLPDVELDVVPSTPHRVVSPIEEKQSCYYYSKSGKKRFISNPKSAALRTNEGDVIEIIDEDETPGVEPPAKRPRSEDTVAPSSSTSEEKKLMRKSSTLKVKMSKTRNPLECSGGSSSASMFIPRPILPHRSTPKSRTEEARKVGLSNLDLMMMHQRKKSAEDAELERAVRAVTAKRMEKERLMLERKKGAEGTNTPSMTRTTTTPDCPKSASKPSARPTTTSPTTSRGLGESLLQRYIEDDASLSVSSVSSRSSVERLVKIADKPRRSDKEHRKGRKEDEEKVEKAKKKKKEDEKNVEKVKKKKKEDEEKVEKIKKKKKEDEEKVENVKKKKRKNDGKNRSRRVLPELPPLEYSTVNDTWVTFTSSEDEQEDEEPEIQPSSKSRPRRRIVEEEEPEEHVRVVHIFKPDPEAPTPEAPAPAAVPVTIPAPAPAPVTVPAPAPVVSRPKPTSATSSTRTEKKNVFYDLLFGDLANTNLSASSVDELARRFVIAFRTRR